MNLRLLSLQGHGPHGVLPDESIWLELQVGDRVSNTICSRRDSLTSLIGSLFSVSGSKGDIVHVRLKGTMEGHGMEEIGCGHFEVGACFGSFSHFQQKWIA